MEEDLNEGDIYDYLDETIGTRLSGGRHIKYADTGTAMEFAIDSLQVTLRNAPLAPSDPANAQRFEADAVVRLEVPSPLWRQASSIHVDHIKSAGRLYGGVLRNAWTF